MKRLLILILLCAVPSFAADFYVDKGSRSCSNSPSGGSEAAPWCTITYGIGNMPAGSTLYVKEGVYNEGLYIDRPSGTATSPTVIRAYPKHAVVIRGEGVNSGRLKFSNVSRMVFDGFEVTNFNQGIFVEGSSFITLINNRVHHVGQEAIRVHLNSSNVTVANNVIHDTRQWMYNGEGVYVGSSSSGPLDNTNNVTIRNNQIFNINDEAVELKPGTHDCIVEGNTIHDAMRDPAYSGGAGAIEVNEATIDCPACAGRRQTWGSNPNHIVRNNVVHTSKTGIRLGTGATAYNNVVYNTPAPYYGILLTNNARDSYPRTVYHNTVNVDASRAVFGSGDIRNNIGPATTGNIAATSSLFVNAAAGDFHLVRNSAPINAGADLTSNVPTDMEGRARTQPDFGAYEFNGLTPAPAPPPPPPD